MHLSFASPWVDLQDTPGELFFMTNKNHSKPHGKEYKINDKKPFPSVIYTRTLSSHISVQAYYARNVKYMEII